MSQVTVAILSGLEEASAVLHAGDAHRGAELLDQVQAACDAMTAQGEAFSPDELRRAQELHRMCISAAARVGPTLLASHLRRFEEPPMPTAPIPNQPPIATPERGR
jgi:hypothetical protein